MEPDDYGWSRVAPVVAVLKTPGGHLDFFKPPLAPHAAQRVSGALTLLTQCLQASVALEAPQTAGLAYRSEVA